MKKYPESFLPFDLDATFTSAVAIFMATAVEPSLVKDHSFWPQRTYALLDEMVARGNMVAELIKTELQQLEKILNRFPLSENDETATARRPSNLRRQSIPEENHGRLPNTLSPSPYMASHAMGNDLPMEEFSWQEGFMTEQLINIADSIDMDDLSWLSESFPEATEQE